MPHSTFIDRGVDPPEPDYDDTEDCGFCMEPLYGYGGRRHPVCDAKTEERTCHRCKVVWCDYEKGEPCESCGEPLGEPA